MKLSERADELAGPGQVPGGASGAPGRGSRTAAMGPSSSTIARAVARELGGGGGIRIARWADPRLVQLARNYIASAPPLVLPRIVAALRAAQAAPPPGSGVPVPLRVAAGDGYGALDTRVAFEDLPALLGEAQGAATARPPVSRPPAEEPAAPGEPACGDDRAAPHGDDPAASDGDRAPRDDAAGRVPGYLPSASTVGGSVMSARDAHLRLTRYVGPSRELAERVWADYQAGRIDHAGGRVAAAEGRNQLLRETRAELSPQGRALSRAVRDEGQSMASLADRYARRLIERDAAVRAQVGLRAWRPNQRGFDAAAYQRAVESLRESREVSESIMRSAGRSNPVMTPMARTLRVVAPVLAVTGVVASGYTIVTAPDGTHAWTAGRELTRFAGGTFGNVAGGVVGAWVASAACGPAAPACAIVLTFTITAAASYAASEGAAAAYDRAVPVEPELDHPERFGPAVGGTAAFASGGGYRGAMDRDRRALDGARAEGHRGPPVGPAAPPPSSGGEAYIPSHDANPGPVCDRPEPAADHCEEPQ